ncbi:MAG: hypothetical protein SH821_06900 [Phototrophicales bacterium]|mgnify:CR=1 FL=1|nr:hypothetical protein [Phototrophicales bacterium]
MNFNPFKGKKERQEKLKNQVKHFLKQCPICQHNETRKIGIGAGASGIYLARLDTSSILPLLPYVVHQCTRCGYVMIFGET